jgi:transposase
MLISFPPVNSPVGEYEKISLFPNLVVIHVSSALTTAHCPLCSQLACRIHSHYERRMADLPWQGIPVRLLCRIRRFFCDNSTCPRRIFAERMPDITQAYAHKTCRLTTALQQIGLVCGGEAGARLACRLGMLASPDTLLRIIRHTPMSPMITPRVLGVDDWAFLRGQRYGTILCDLELHRPVDLLPERSAEAFRKWLTDHPGVEIISRDRGDFYIKGATSGAPHAIQVADRWHLLHNLREALLRLVERHAQQVKTAALVAWQQKTPSDEAVQVLSNIEFDMASTKTTRAEQLRETRREERMKRYEEVMELHRQGISKREIARQTGIHRGTVRGWISAGSFPEHASRRYRSGTDSFLSYLNQRWQEGCHNAKQLDCELRQRGFSGSYDMVRRKVAHWRSRDIAIHSAPKYINHQPREAMTRPSSRRVAWLLVKKTSDLTTEEYAFLTALSEQCMPLAKVKDLAQLFVEMVKERKVGYLDTWRELVCASDVPVELRHFAKGLGKDLAAVKASLSLPWSNGQTEGQVNRLKLIKRQMFGRAKFDLLRQRFLFAG